MNVQLDRGNYVDVIVMFPTKKSWNSGNYIMNQKGTDIGKTCISFLSKVGPLKSVQAK